MPDVIKDGKGRNYSAGVNSDNQLITRATAVEQRLASAIDENYLEATTGKVTLSDANETGIIYVENDQTDQSKFLIIDRVFFDVWESTGGTGSGTLKYYRNPIITGGTDITPANTNFSSNQSGSVSAKKSLTTITGTAWWTAQFTASSSLEWEEGRIAIPSGYSFGISIEAPTSNSSMDVSVNIAMYVIDIKLIS